MATSLAMAGFLLAFVIHMSLCMPAAQARSAFPFAYASSSPPYSAYPLLYTPAFNPLPAPHHHHHHQHHHHQKLQQPAGRTAVVTGHVFCDVCKDGQLKEPLKGVTIGVTCWNGEVEQSFYGITNSLGNFKVKLSGFNLQKLGGGKACRAKLIYPSFRTPCMLPTNLHDGKLGAPLRIKSKNPKKLVLFAGPFAYTTTSKKKNCHHKGGRLKSAHKGKRYLSHSKQHLDHNSRSCPAYDCKNKVPPPPYTTLSMTQLRKSDVSHTKQYYTGSSPQHQNFKRVAHPSYLMRNSGKDLQKSHHFPIFSSSL